MPSSNTIASLWDSHSGQPLQCPRPKPTKGRASRSKSISTNYGNSLKDQMKAIIVDVPGSPRSVTSNGWLAASELLQKSDNNLLNSSTSSAKSVRKALKGANNPQEKKAKKSLSFTNSKVLHFDPNSIVSSLLQSAPVFSSEQLDTPWYEQDYQELPWWEQPDLTEDDEIRVLCKKVTCQNENTPRVQRVEILVYTAALKMIHLAQQKKKHTKSSATSTIAPSKRDSPPRHPRRASTGSSRGQPHPPVQIPTMFVGLIKEVHSEKRRYKRKSSKKKSDNTANEKKQPEKKQPEPAKEKPAAAPAARVRRITRLYNSSRTLASSDVNTDIETPAAWNRSTKPVAPTRTRPRRTKSTGASTSSSSSSPTTSTNPRQEARRNIQKLKEQLKASKQAQKRLEGAKVEQKDAQKRAEAQERRLERLRLRSLK